MNKIQNIARLGTFDIQGEHKVFPLLQTFITRKLRGIQTYFFSKCNSTQEVFSKCNSTQEVFSKCNSTQEVFSKCNSTQEGFFKV